MKAFIYNLLSKGMLILLLLAVMAVFYYRAELFPQYFPRAADQAELTPADNNDKVTPQTLVESASAEPDPVTASSQQDDVVKVTDGTDSTVAEGAAVQWPSASSTDASTDAESSEPTDATAVAEQAPLLQARSAYWAGNLDGAVSAYQSAAAARPDDPDVHGELGNIYFAQGNWQKAAAAYRAAGQALLKRGDRAAAGHLVVLLQGLDPEQARELAEQLNKPADAGRQ